MLRLFRSPLWLTLLAIGSLIAVMLVIVSLIWWLQPSLLVNSTADQPAAWRSEMRLAENQTGAPRPQGIFQYQNDAWTIGLKADSEPGQPFIWQTQNGDFTLTLRIASLATDGLTVPQPLITYASDAEPGDGFAVQPIYLAATSAGEKPRYALGRLKLYQDRYSATEPLYTTELAQPNEVLLNQQPPVWLRVTVKSQQGRVEYSLDGNEWLLLGQVERQSTGSGRLRVGLAWVQPTATLAPTITFDNFTLQ